MCTLSLPSKQTRRARQGACSRALTAVSGVEPKALDSSECPVHLQVWLLGLAFKALPCPLTSSLPTHQDSVLRSILLEESVLFPVPSLLSTQQGTTCNLQVRVDSSVGLSFLEWKLAVGRSWSLFILGLLTPLALPRL